MGKAFSEIMTLLATVLGVAIVAVVLSKKADTANVLTTGGKAFSDIIKAAVSPLTAVG